MIVKSSKLSNFKIKKLVWCFCVDVEADKIRAQIEGKRYKIEDTIYGPSASSSSSPKPQKNQNN